ncbi:MAG: magnesium transporter, partial [Steroidobacteraceae bacterium]
MLNIFIQRPQGLARTTPGSPPRIPDEAIWVDLLEPTPEEEKLVEATLTIDVPTREEMKEIETSNRLYEDNGALYMTSTV